jgi:hypothetical protein
MTVDKINFEKHRSYITAGIALLVSIDIETG